MHEIPLKLFLGQLQSIGLFRDERATVADLRSRVIAPYQRWLDETIAVLERSGELSSDGRACVLRDPSIVDLDAAWAEWNARKARALDDPSAKAQAALVEATLRALPAILTGEQPATGVMFPSSSMRLVEGIYKNNPVSDHFNEALADAVVAYLKERLLEEPSAKIRLLEIGAGTGGTSAMLFRKLKPYQAHVREYCYTDVSKAFLMHAETEYGPHCPFLSYKLLNVEQPLSAQGVEVGGYDLVIAANVLHATKNVRQSLRHAKEALRPNGLLMLNEISVNSLFTHLTFGLLEGWWRYEDPELRIPGCPGLSPQSWQRALEAEGYREVFFPAERTHDLGQQIVVAESDGVVAGQARQPAPAMDAPARRATPSGAGALPPSLVAEQVRTAIRESICETLKMTEDEIQDDLSFAEYGVDSILAVNLINLVNDKCGLTMQTTVLFDYNSVDALSRHIVASHGAALTARARESAPLDVPAPAPAPAPLYVAPPLAPQGLASVPAERAVRAAAPAVAVAPLARPPAPTVVEPLERSADLPTYHKVVIERPGTIDDLRLVEAVVPELSNGEVQIAVRAFSLNFGDILCVRGLYPTMPPYPFTPGFEASGVVVKVGRAVTAVAPGDEVIFGAAEAFGAQATLITCAQEQVSLKPEGLTFEEACSLPTVALTMIDAFRKAQPKKGERVLVQTATGGTGLIAVQLALHLGAEIYATAGSQHKLDYLKRMGVHHVINYLESDFEREVKRLTNGEGVDVVINTLSGTAIQKGLNCLRSGGRYVELAMTALKSAKSIDLSVLNNNQVFYSVDLRKLCFEKPETIAEYQGELSEYIRRGVVRPTIFGEFSFEQIKDAYRCLDNRGNIGKIVVSIPEVYQYREVEGAGAAARARLHAVLKEPIAIIGMSGRFARSRDPGELWQHLAAGRDLTDEVKRWDLSRELPADKPYCNYGSFLDDLDRFDPVFFNISGREATYMDPQQRLFLEEAWNALEDAGYVGEHIGGLQCGVYAGCCVGDYQVLFDGEPPAQAFWGNHNAVIPSRISYHLNLQGPAVTIDTACSSSLVAIHNACQALWMHEIDMALAGGVFVQSTPGFYISSNRAGMLSPTGKCRAFDQGADGFVPGEGVGLVVLKRLSEAIADGDQIHGVIRGSGLNQDGTTNGITAPSALSQERLERSVYEAFQIDPAQIQMVEAHGTGTKLGDPIEFDALSKAFRAYTDKKEFCAIGSVKTNLGHTSAAAGMAGVLKILLALKNKQIPPSLHFREGNAHITFKDSPFYVNTTLREWQVARNERRRAAVSSFGFSGTNAHLVIEEAPRVVRRRPAAPGYLIVLSARTEEQLRQQVERLVAHCEQHGGVDLGDLSYTLLLGRRHFKHRLAVVVRDRDELLKVLRRVLEKGRAPQAFTGNLQENPRREVSSLKRYGEQCIQECRSPGDADRYVENLAGIAELFVQGYGLELANLFARGAYSKLSLPTYPFSRERYWVAEARREAPARAPQAPSAATAPPRPASAPEAVAPASVSAAQLREELRRSLAEILFIKPADIDVNAKFVEMGLDSIIGVEWVQSINKKYGITLTANNVYAHPTLAEFAELLASELRAGQGQAAASPAQGAVLQPVRTAPAPTPPRPAAPPSAAGVTVTAGAPSAPASAPVSVHRRAVASSKEMQEQLVESLAELLFLARSDIDVDKKFIEMGLDSILGVEWVHSLNKKYGVSITANNVYENPTVAEFARFLAGELNGAPAPAPAPAAPALPPAPAVAAPTAPAAPPAPAAPAPRKPAAIALQPVSTMPSPRPHAGAPARLTLTPVSTIQAVPAPGPRREAPRHIQLSPLQPVPTGGSAPQAGTTGLRPVTYNGNGKAAPVRDPAPLPQAPAPAASPQISELVALNRGTVGRPVFWLHAALGGVELYQPLAPKVQRPFYGIQARGWLTDQPPVEGIRAMASHYVQIIRSVQPQGPYDLGGYSLGGMLAYEVTRQLQEQGEVVNSIVMLDTFDSIGARKIDIPDSLFDKSLALQTVNASLFLPIVEHPEKMASTLIHRSEANVELDYEEFLERLIQRAQSRGLTRSENLMHEMIKQCAKVQAAYKITEYVIEPLPRPAEVACYYFRNKNGHFFGELEPYFAIADGIYMVDQENYWSEWEQRLPNLSMIDVDASNHMWFLSEAAVFETVSRFCESLYSLQGMPPQFHEAFRLEAERIHGRMSL
ncbi:beta-ketoacyl synthase N-terminal-like domain-containing protein [Sorangium sp. So ce887]|uniref:beta-ketoacyl synthase N-terminal-like domain-containing protein n=1 Tax=Sorangium sp. So ce887 TaxID=3133324 RepID=UPI003F5DBD42